jgi:predicted nucleotide-binding protein
VATINADLLTRIMHKEGLQKAAAYNRVTKKANELFLSRDLAALAVAAELGIPINKYATREQIDKLRTVTGSKSSSPATSHPPPTVAPRVVRTSRTTGRSKTKSISKKPANSVFVVHGRDENIRKSMFLFLRSIGLNPIEWVKAIEMTGKGSPHVSEILDAAFANARAIVIILTPDDEARLRPHFQKSHDPDYEKSLTGQARPNVIFEAGLAFGRNENGTILVEIGTMRPFTDIGGMHTVRLSNSPESRTQLATKLRNADCNPDTTATDWLSAGDFTLTAPPAEKPKKKR